MEWVVLSLGALTAVALYVAIQRIWSTRTVEEGD
jgi:hypothetical protein